MNTSISESVKMAIKNGNDSQWPIYLADERSSAFLLDGHTVINPEHADSSMIDDCLHSGCRNALAMRDHIR